MRITIDLEFEEEDVVYFKTDRDNTPHIITGWSYRQGLVIYYASSCGIEKFGYGYELSTDKNLMY